MSIVNLYRPSAISYSVSIVLNTLIGLLVNKHSRRVAEMAVRSRSSDPNREEDLATECAAQLTDVVNVDEWRRRRPERSGRPGISVLE